MRSMHQALMKQKRLLSCVGRWHCGDPGFAVHRTVSSRLLAQPRQRHDDHTCSAGTLGRRASCGWLNGDAVVQRLEWPACTAQTSSRALGPEDTCIPSNRACTWPDLPHRASAAQREGAASDRGRTSAARNSTIAEKPSDAFVQMQWRGWPPRTCPQRVALTNLFVVQVKRYEHNYRDPPEKFCPSRPAFRGHSTSSELTRIDRLPMTSYYRLHTCSTITTSIVYFTLVRSTTVTVKKGAYTWCSASSRGTGRVSGQGGQNSAQSAEKIFRLPTLVFSLPTLPYVTVAHPVRIDQVSIKCVSVMS